MRTHWILLAIVACLSALAAGPILAGLEAGNRDTLVGAVIEVRQECDQDWKGQFTEIRVRNWDGEEHWLRLGPAAEYAEKFRYADQVRVRALGVAPDQPALVFKIRNYRTSETFRIRHSDGTLRAETHRPSGRSGAHGGG